MAKIDFVYLHVYPHMNKHKFTDAERFAVWLCHGKKCYWCGEPMRYRESTVDHVLPEHLLEKPEQLKKELLEYGLPSDFKLNSFGNWLPCHDKCNKSKGGKVMETVPLTKAILDKLIRKEPAVKKAAERIGTDVNKDKILGDISAALEKGNLQPNDVAMLVSELRKFSDGDSDILEAELDSEYPDPRLSFEMARRDLERLEALAESLHNVPMPMDNDPNKTGRAMIDAFVDKVAILTPLFYMLPRDVVADIRALHQDINQCFLEANVSGLSVNQERSDKIIRNLPLVDRRIATAIEDKQRELRKAATL
jgi:5-methylcytosine-specific restriction endonuclease McrA